MICYCACRVLYWCDCACVLFYSSCFSPASESSCTEVSGTLCFCLPFWVFYSVFWFLFLIMVIPPFVLFFFCLLEAMYTVFLSFLGSLCLLAEPLFCSFSEGTFREQGVLHCSVDSCFAHSWMVFQSSRADKMDYMDFFCTVWWLQNFSYHLLDGTKDENEMERLDNTEIGEHWGAKGKRDCRDDSDKEREGARGTEMAKRKWSLQFWVWVSLLIMIFF